jgi:carotenoid cleavage dioxygenase-like enzyme
VVVDICTYRDPEIVRDLYLERLRAGKPLSQPSLERFRISTGDGTVTTEALADHALELPRINYGRCNERPYRYVWGVSDGPDSGWLEQIVKADVAERRTVVWEEPGSYPGEPVFVAAPDAKAEDEGVLLSVVLNGERGNSFLLVVDARSLDELARAEVPHHIPFGFHGQYARG